MQIAVYCKTDEQAVIDLILPIQQIEFGVPVTIADQPDLLDVENFYCRGAGNFWVIKDGNKLVGSIALIDIGNGQSALRKMFVQKEYRGKEKGLGQQLLDHVIAWCRSRGINEIFLGTFDRLEAAQQFYRKNGFELIPKHALPATFPLMQVDNRFFKLTIQ